MYSQRILNTYKRSNLIIESGSGCWVTDTCGKKYLDMVAGVAVNSLGHCHPNIIETVKNQVEKLIHVSNLYWTKEQSDLAEKLVDLSDHKGVFFCNSGSEAIEGALKVARKYGKSKEANKNKIICFSNSFHGRTMGALSVTAQKKYQETFEPLIGDVIVCDFNDVEALKASVSKEVCAIIVEPIQGEGGIVEATQTFMNSLKTLCEAHEILLIFDEVQCGIGRLGTFFAYESLQVIPDILCLAKGLGSGIPIGAFIVNEKADILSHGDHGSTFGGNPLVSAVANEVIDIVSDEKFLKSVKDKGAYLQEALFDLMDISSQIIEVRGQGLMIGIEVEGSAQDLCSKMLDKNVLVITAGANIIRIVPPLVISYEEIDLFIDRFKEVIV